MLMGTAVLEYFREAEISIIRIVTLSTRDRINRTEDKYICVRVCVCLGERERERED